MPRSITKKKPTRDHEGLQFHTDRELERRFDPGTKGKKARNNVLKRNYPSQHEFGPAEYMDNMGREYRLAYLDRMDGWPPHTLIPPRELRNVDQIRAAKRGASRTALWVQLKQGRSMMDWPETSVARTIELRPMLPGLAPQLVRITEAYRDNARGRTGLVEVTGLDEEHPY
jgi:hypothetical protein